MCTGKYFAAPVGGLVSRVSVVGNTIRAAVSCLGAHGLA